jgi:asparagine synthase (glutamine-hydrolysing)
MPGLFGLTSVATPHIRARVEAARERMLRHGRMTMDLVATQDETAWLGHARLDGSPRTIVDGGQRPSAVLHGVIYNEAELRQEFGPALVEATGDLLTTMYERLGAKFVERLEGEFAVAILDSSRRSMLVATDTTGTYPVYWHAHGQDFAFSSDLSALLRAVPERTRLDMRSVADFLTIGAVLENRTLVDGVWLLDPGTVLEFRLDDAEGRLSRYVDVASFFANKARDREQYLEAVVAALQRAVDRASTDTRRVGLSLSGGIDSRAILSALNGRATGLSTYTLGVAGSADQIIAKQLASIGKTNHRFFEMDGSYLRDFLPNMSAMVSATDGLYLSHGLTEMLALRFLGETGIGVLLRGHGGELAKAHLAWPLHTDARAYSSASLDEFLPYLAGRANYLTKGLPLNRILMPWAASVAGDGALASFRRVLAGTGLTPAEACSYLYLRELHRRFTVPSLELFRTKVEVRMPFLDTGFLRTLLAAPAEWRDTTDIHLRITKRGMPELLKVRNSNTGAPMDASPRTEYVLDKLNSALKKFNVHGYRHYHNYDEWMRLSLLESVEAELAGEWARTRGFIERATIVSLAKETAEGKTDHSYLLQTLLIMELWMRENRIEAAA